MAIDLATGFNIGSKDAIDERQVLTLEQMKNLDESIYPDKYFAMCKDNGKLYIYDASNDVSETSGKFRVLEGNVIGDSTVVDGARYYTLEEVDLSYHFLLAKINFGDKTSFSGKMTFMFNHASTFKIASIPFTEKKEFFFNHKEGKDFSYVMHAYPIKNPAVSNAAQPVLFNDFNFRGILTENNEFYLFLRGILDTDNYIHNFYIEYIGDGTIEETFVVDDGSTNPYSAYGWSATKWYKEEGLSDSDLIQPGCITLANSDDVVSNSIASKVYGSLRGLGCYDSSVALTVPMYKLYPSQALFCDVTEFSNYQTLFPYEEEADAESRVYILCIARETNYYLRWERKDGTKQAICYNNDRLGQPIVWNMIVGDGGSTEGASTYTSLTELGLTADATVEDVVNTLKNGESFLAPVNTFTNYETIFPNKVPSDQWNKIHIIKGASLPNSHIRCFSQSGACEYLANVNNTNVTGWNDVSGTYTDISDTIIEKLGNEILKYPVGKYRINSIATGNKFTDLPSDAEIKCGLIEVNGTAVGKSPFTDTWVYRMYKFECLTGTLNYIRRLNSGATAGQVEVDTGWQKICVETESKKEEDSYIPNVYDRNANGDMPVVPFDRLANFMAVRSNRGLVSTTETEATYDEDYVGGYVFAGANDVLVKDKEMFNKIKVLVHIPGVLRIGIVNEKIYEANPRYSTCLVKWLVADFVAFTGMKEYDIADTVLEEGQSIFLECRTGVSSWYLNTGEATQVGAVTYPASSCTTGLNVADTLDTTTNNALFKSQKVNSSSCLTSFGNGMYSIGGKIRSNFQERAYNSGATSSKETYENTEYFGGLNIGLYRRTKYSDTRVCKCIENAINNSWVGDDSVTKIYAPYGQEGLVGKSVYAFKLDVRTPGNLTIYHLKGKSLDTLQVIDKYTHYVRGRGLQTIHLPFDIKLNSTDEYIGFGGLHCKSTSDNIVRHSCLWHYFNVTQATWMTTIDNSAKQFYSIGVSMTSYPEQFTSFETNSNYLNIELICRGEKRSPLEDKYISFTGDSITTFAGFCTTQTGYPEGNPAGDNAVYYPASGKVINNVDATWWGILAKDNRMKILRNDAWSGSRVSSTTGSTDTKCLCGANRRYYLRNGYAFATNSTYPYGRPEIIVSMIGTNDLSGGVELGEEMFKGIMGAEEEYKTILSAFSLFCRRIHDQEGSGGTKIVHFLIPRGSDYGYANANGVTIADLSLHFERIAKAWGQYFIPLSYFNGIKPNTPKRWSCPTGSMFKNTAGVEFPSADGLHPNAMGMEVIADGVHRFLCSIM